jgi:Flp pilus assembly protein TadG
MTPARYRQRLSLRLRRGQAVAEFALILPVMLLMMLIAVDFGRLFFTYIQVNNAAREAANYAAAHAIDYQSNPLDYQGYHDSVAAAGLAEANNQTQTGATTPMAISSPACFTPGTPPTSIDCTSAPEIPAKASGIGNQVSVTVTQQFTFLTPLINSFFGGGLNLSSTATATVLNQLVAQIQAASPSPGASTAPSAFPSSAPSAAPSANPTACHVPNFYHLFYSGTSGSALQAWQSAGFTVPTHLIDNTGGHMIQSQSVSQGTLLSCSTGTVQVSNH